MIEDDAASSATPDGEEASEGVRAKIVAQGRPDDLQRMATRLAEADVPARIIPPPPDLGLPPGQIFLLVVPEDRGDDAEALIEEAWREEVGSEGHQAAVRVADFDGETTECPACGEIFATTEQRCPECGLNFGS